MNVWFGTHWGAEVCNALEQVPPPVGETCRWCEEPILTSESGWGESAHGPWMHVECVTRMLLGSVGHQLGICRCVGEHNYEDPTTLTRREAAKVAFEQAQTSRALQPYIVCPRCGAVSHHPKDISERYCGRCHRFHDEGN